MLGIVVTYGARPYQFTSRISFGQALVGKLQALSTIPLPGAEPCRRKTETFGRAE